MGFTVLMNDEAGIRRANLRKLGKSATELARLGVGGYSYWAAMLAENSKKPFGEKAARQLEEILGLPRGLMDQPIVTKEDDHYIIRGKQRSLDIDWPFTNVERDQYLALPPDSQLLVQSQFQEAITKEITRLYLKQESPKKTSRAA